MNYDILRKPAGRLGEVPPCERNENIEGVWGRGVGTKRDQKRTICDALQRFLAMFSYFAKYSANHNAQKGVFSSGLEHAVLRELTYFELFPSLGPPVGWWRTSRKYCYIYIYTMFYYTLPLKTMLYKYIYIYIYDVF